MKPTYEAFKRGYANLWVRAQLKPDRRAGAHAIARKLYANRERYAAAAIGAVPWWWVAIVHSLESGVNFSRHLHNGDPLNARTVHVPAGRPIIGNPPFSWEESARDALTMKGLHEIQDWNISRCLFEFERYNGFGYVARGINSPYLWSFTTLYDSGKYVADGKFSAAAVSQQCGAVAILKALIELGLVSAPGAPEPSPAITKPTGVKVAPRTPQWDIIGWLFSILKRAFA